MFFPLKKTVKKLLPSLPKSTAFSLMLFSIFIGSCQTTQNTVVAPETSYALLEDGKTTVALPMAKPTPTIPNDFEITQDPTILVGYPEATVRDLFGKETLIRTDGASLIYQYYTKKCALDVFLYNETDGDHSYVIEHLEARSISDDVSKERCMRNFLSKDAVSFERFSKQRYNTASGR